MTEAPRWRLMSAHYLNVPQLPDGTRVEWEHKETDQQSGRSIRKLYAIPILLNPADGADCNYPGDLIVAQFVEGATIPIRDYVFIGDPTPEMEPLNEAAQAITNTLRQKWDHPMSKEGLEQAGKLNSQEQAFLNAMTTALSNANVGHQPNTALVPDDYNEMKERLAKLEAMIVAQGKAPAHTDRRV